MNKLYDVRFRRNNDMHLGGRFKLVVLVVTLTLSAIICFILDSDSHAQTLEVPIQKQEKVDKQDIIIEETQPETIEENESGFNAYDSYLLAKIAMAEAEQEDVEGKALVMRVVLNRVNASEFPDTINDVIYQKSGKTYQFSPIGDGRWDKVEPNDECYEALDMINEGWDNSEGALYFRATRLKRCWHDRALNMLFTHGRHIFYK